MKFKVLFFLISLFCFSCTDPPLEELAQEMAVSTTFDTDVDFGTYSTFVIREDTVGVVSSQTDSTYTVSPYASAITDRITNKMSSKGFTQVDVDNDPDLGIYAYILFDFNLYQQYYYPSSYSGYYGGYGYYGSYYPYVSTHYSQYATLVIEIVDIKNSTPTQLNVIWRGYMGDLYAASYLGALSQQTDHGIDQAFDQSDYLIATE